MDEQEEECSMLLCNAKTRRRCVICGKPVCKKRRCSISVGSFVRQYQLDNITAVKGQICDRCQVQVRDNQGLPIS